MTKAKTDERVTKRRVTMTGYAVSTRTDSEGSVETIVQELKAIDFVRPDLLDAYVADARTRWEHVEVSDEPDAGPAGYDGATTDHANRRYYPATGCKNCSHAPDGYETIRES